MKSEIDRSSPVPLYFQLKKIIKDSIADGSLKPGDVIPTEAELMDKYNISRATIRQAISGLVNEGYLRRERAKGTFIKYPPVERKFLGNLKCFSEEMKRKGIAHSTKVLENIIEAANSNLAEKLYLNENDPVFLLRRLRLVDKSPILIVRSYVPYELCPGIEKIDFNKNSLYNTLEKQYGIHLHRGQRIIEPKIVDSDETMSLLGIKQGTCISFIESTICDTNNRPVEYLQAEMIGKISIDIG